MVLVSARALGYSFGSSLRIPDIVGALSLISGISYFLGSFGLEDSAASLQ